VINAETASKISIDELMEAQLITREWGDYLYDFGSAYTAEQATNALNLLIKLRGRRELMETVRLFASLDFTKTDLQEQTNQLIAKVNEIVNKSLTSKLRVIDSPQVLDIVRDVFSPEQEFKQLPTFTMDLDKTISFSRNNLVVVAGNAGSGKTYLALNMYTKALKAKHSAIFFTTEMSDHQVVKRLCGIYTGDDLSQANKLTVAQLESITEEIGFVQHNMVYNQRLTLSDVRKHLIALKKRQGKVDYVFIDYLTRMEVPNLYKDYRLNVAYTIRELKTLAAEFDCVMVVLAQLSRKNMDRPNKRPMLSDLAESSAIEQEADLVFFTYSEQYFATGSGRQIDPRIKGVIEINVAKNRHGKNAQAILRFDESGRHQELESHSKREYNEFLSNKR
jgi:replicative DNA helicase